MRRYLAQITGLSRPQVIRLIGCYQQGAEVKQRAYQRHRFPNRYTGADIEVLAAVDDAPRNPQRSGHAEDSAAGDSALGGAALPAAQKPDVLPAPRRLSTYPAHGSGHWRETQARSARSAGYRRVDTVHQGDLDGVKGLFHINAVDEVTQWQVVGATAQISEAWLMPVLEAMMRQFSFHIRGFHSDNGIEFINHTVAQMLNKLLVEQTKSRTRHSNDTKPAARPVAPARTRRVRVFSRSWSIIARLRILAKVNADSEATRTAFWAEGEQSVELSDV